jgi:hypothetical protein
MDFFAGLALRRAVLLLRFLVRLFFFELFRAVLFRSRLAMRDTPSRAVAGEDASSLRMYRHLGVYSRGKWAEKRLES